MAAKRRDWPTDPRPYVAYRPPPSYQPTRSSGVRDVWADTLRFIERATKPYAGSGEELVLVLRRWTPESLEALPERLRRGTRPPWPGECSAAAFDTALRLARERFGTPTYAASPRLARSMGLEQESGWRVATGRADEVLDYLERVAPCTLGERPPIRASYWCEFRLRDLVTGALLRGQGRRYHPVQSTLWLDLEHRSFAHLRLTLPFAQPDDAPADYVVALQEYAPVWMDPRYFDHLEPTPDGSYQRYRLPPDWIGLTPDGRLRLDPARSGIVPQTLDLPRRLEIGSHDPAPGRAAFEAHVAAVETALREHSQAAILIRGPFGSATRRLAEQAAQRVGMSLHRVTLCGGRPGAELAKTLADCGDGPRVLLLEGANLARPAVRKQVQRLVSTRVLGKHRLAPELRLIVTEETEPGDEALAAARRATAAHMEGFASPDQLRYLNRRATETANAEITVTLEPRTKDPGGE